MMSSSERVAYLDCAASAPLRPEALEVMLPYLTEHHGNPSGSHAVARRARRGVDEARDIVAEATGATPHGVVFTSGGTEADNLAVTGSLGHGRAAVCAATEHHAVLDPVTASGGHVVRVDGADPDLGTCDSPITPVETSPDLDSDTPDDLDNDFGFEEPLGTGTIGDTVWCDGLEGTGNGVFDAGEGVAGLGEVVVGVEDGEVDDPREGQLLVTLRLAVIEPDCPKNAGGHLGLVGDEGQHDDDNPENDH